MTCPGVDYRSFDVTFLHQTCPDEVRCWLFCAEYDAVDIAAILAAAGFRGLLRTRSRPMPKTAMIRREIHRVCPGLRLRLDMVPPLAVGHHAYDTRISHPGRPIGRETGTGRD
jgi:hypothetical protein